MIMNNDGNDLHVYKKVWIMADPSVVSERERIIEEEKNGGNGRQLTNCNYFN